MYQRPDTGTFASFLVIPIRAQTHAPSFDGRPGNFCLLSYNVGQVVPSTNGLLSTVGFKLGGEPCTYALEGSIAYAGSTVQWLRDNLEVGDGHVESVCACP